MHKINWKLLILLTFFCNIVNAVAIPENKQALIEELQELINSDQVIEDIGQGIAANMRESLSMEGVEMVDEFFEIIANATGEVVTEILIDNPDIRDRNYQLWDKLFDNTELQQLVEFYQSPLGEKLIAKMPEVSASNINAVMAVEQEFIYTLQVRMLEKLNDAGYDTKDLFNGDVALTDAPNWPSSSELTDMENKACAMENNSAKAIPIYRGKPLYPYVARRFSIEGWVELYFSITQEGSTENIRISNASTGTIFDTAAIEAVQKYVYCPGARTENTAIRIRFEIEKQATDLGF